MSLHGLCMWVIASLHFYLVRLEALKEAMANHQDLEIIKNLFQEGEIPNDVRADLWKVRKTNI